MAKNEGRSRLGLKPKYWLDPIRHVRDHQPLADYGGNAFRKCHMDEQNTVVNEVKGKRLGSVFRNGLFLGGVIASQAFFCGVVFMCTLLWFEYGWWSAALTLAGGLLLLVSYFYVAGKIMARLWAAKRFSDGFGALVVFLAISAGTGLTAVSCNYLKGTLEDRFISPLAARIFGPEASGYLMQSLPKHVVFAERPASLEFESSESYPTQGFKDGPACCIQTGDGTLTVDEVLFPSNMVCPAKDLAVSAPSEYPISWGSSVNAYYKKAPLTATIVAPKDLKSLLVVRGRLKLPILFAKPENGGFSNSPGTNETIVEILLLPRQYDISEVDRLLSMSAMMGELFEAASIMQGLFMVIAPMAPLVVRHVLDSKLSKKNNV